MIMFQCHQRSKVTFLWDSVALIASSQWKADTAGNCEPPPYLQKTPAAYLKSIFLPWVLVDKSDTWAAIEMRRLAEADYTP